MYRRVEWVPHLFLVARFRSRLSNFLRKGPSINLLDYTSHEVQQRVAERSVTTGVPVSPTRVAHHTAVDDDDAIEDDVIRTPAADPDADLRIPSAWRLVDRILYVYFWNPGRAQKKNKQQQQLFARQRARRVVSTSSEEESDDEDQQERAQLQDGVKPDDPLLETWIDRRDRKHITEKDADDVVWAYMKWQDLPYETCTRHCRECRNC
jgi:chromodomain-helicase-DNA-binding protein 4